jgi:hypothetical protein
MDVPPDLVPDGPIKMRSGRKDKRRDGAKPGTP